MSQKRSSMRVIKYLLSSLSNPMSRSCRGQRPLALVGPVELAGLTCLKPVKPLIKIQYWIRLRVKSRLSPCLSKRSLQAWMLKTPKSRSTRTESILLRSSTETPSRPFQLPSTLTLLRLAAYIRFILRVLNNRMCIRGIHSIMSPKILRVQAGSTLIPLVWFSQSSRNPSMLAVYKEST